MIDRIHRYFIERIRSTEDITIQIGRGRDMILLTFQMSKVDISKLRHDIALGVQDFFNNASHSKFPTK